jgi:hypothetical protein
MNQRIKELAEQAGFMDSWFSESGDDCERELKKFAELIIQECLEVAEKQIGGGNGDGVEWDRAVDFTYDDIKSYFGVER